MKTFILLISAALFTLTACATPTAVPTAMAPTVAPTTAAPAAPTIAPVSTDVTAVDENGNTSIDPTALSEALSPTPSSALTSAELEALLYMREEEKLAHDVYVMLYAKWGLPIFQNISDSEQTHTEAVKTLIDRYGLPDPAAGKEVGVFVNPTLQGLYDQLVARGGQSLADALKVGAAIEEIDILDLELRLAQTDKADIQLVYENLMKGSRNHLRSFTSTLASQTGETYQPQYLSQASYDTIVGTPIEGGGAGGGRHGPPPGAGPTP